MGSLLILNIKESGTQVSDFQIGGQSGTDKRALKALNPKFASTMIYDNAITTRRVRQSFQHDSAAAVRR